MGGRERVKEGEKNGERGGGRKGGGKINGVSNTAAAREEMEVSCFYVNIR